MKSQSDIITIDKLYQKEMVSYLITLARNLGAKELCYCQHDSFVFVHKKSTENEKKIEKYRQLFRKL